MDVEQGKLFVGGISWETSEERLKEYFGKYGEISQANIMRDKISGRPRGFGFVNFTDPSVIDLVLKDKHDLDGRLVEAKRAMSREEQQNTTRTGNNNGGRNGGASGNIRTKKIFVGGLPPTLTEEGFRQYFEGFGQVTDVVIMFDQNTQRPRGFGFVSFDSEDAVDRVLENNTFHELDGKQVEVKRALPKDANPGMASRGRGGGFGGYNSSGNQNSYDSRIDSNRYMQPQNTGTGFPPYGSSGYGAAAYGAAGYGYGLTNGGMGYGGYGYGAPSSAAYGNPNVPNLGYGSGITGAPRSLWNAQAASGYGASGYGNAGPAGQSLSGATGYGSQGYGYGNYGTNTSVGAGGELPGGYGSGYTDAKGLGGYANGAQMGYGGGYGGAQN